MMQDLFHRGRDGFRWNVRSGVRGHQGYAWSLSSFTSTIPRFKGQRVVIDGMSRFIVRDGLIAEYRESVNGGVAMAAARRSNRRGWERCSALDGWLKERRDASLSGAAERLARATPITETTGRSRELSAIFSRGERQRSRHHAQQADRMNAWTAIMERDVRHAMEDCQRDDDVRFVVLTGAGRAFCAGADMGALQGIDPNEIRRGESTPVIRHEPPGGWQTRYAYYPAIPKPVIGMLNGATAGHRPGPRALLRSAICGRQHRLHHLIRRAAG